MSAESTIDEAICSHYCTKPGQYRRGCPALVRNKGNKPPFKRNKAGAPGVTGKKWRSIYKSTTHKDADCYRQGAPRPQERASRITTATSPHINDEPYFTQDFNFDRLRRAHITAELRRAHHDSGHWRNGALRG